MQIFQYQKLINYNSTIMSKAKNLKPKVIQDSDDASDSPLPAIKQKPSKHQQLQAKKVSKIPPKPESDQEQDTPIVEKKPQKQVKAQPVVAKKPIQAPKKVVKQESSEEQSEEPPKKVTKVKSPVQKVVAPPKKVVKKQSSQEEQSQEEKPKKVVVKAKSPVQKPIVPAKKKVQESSQQQESEEVVPVKAKVTKVAPKAASPALKAKSPLQKPVVNKKPVKPETSSQEESEEEEVVPVKTLQKAKSPVQKPKSPAQKPVVPKKKVQESSEEQSEEEKPVKKVVAPVKGKAVKKVEQSEEEQEQLEAPKNNKKVEAPKHQAPAPIDEEGEFQVIVKGLSFQAYQSDIEDLFNPFGNVISVKLLTRDDGKSKGLAFIKFSSKASFNKALELNGTEQFGRQIVVEESLGKQNNGGGFQKGGNFKNNSFGNNQSKYPTTGAVIETPTLFIGGLSYNSTQDSIANYFSQVGEVVSARIVTDRETGKPRGFGYVEFHDVDTAKKAYATLNSGNLDGRQIRLDSAAQRDKPQGGFGGGYGGGQGGARGPPRSSNVNLTQDDKNAKKGSITQFQGKIISL